MLSHASLGVRDLVRSLAFYDAALGALGCARVWTHETAAGYGPPGHNDQVALFVETDHERLCAGPGFHLAFAAPGREAVNRFQAAALAAGGRCDGPPGPRPRYGPTYYAAFVLDPDGHKLEAVHQERPVGAGLEP